MAIRTVDTFDHAGHRLVYETHGRGPKVLVYLHGLLLDAALNRSIAAGLADRGHRVVLPELLGHGRSDQPTHAYEHRLEFLADQTEALLDHLGLEEVVLGGVSLGANVALEVAARQPDRVRALVAEMPVLERGAVAATGVFFPMLLALRYLGGVLRPLARLARHVPRTGSLPTDAFLDRLSADPRASAAVIHGLFTGPAAPPARVRRGLDLPALVIGHGGDLLHPMNDATALADELPNARLVRAWSVIEARTFPRRLIDEMDRFLAEAWTAPAARTPTA